MHSRRCHAFAVLALCLLARTGAAQSAAPANGEKLAVARRILVVTKAADMIVQTMTAALPAQRQATPQLPGDFFDTLLVRARSQADTLLVRLTPAFAEVYTLDELRGLLAFYESPVGKRMIELQPAVMARTMAIGQQWGMELGGSVAQEFIRAGRLNPDSR